MAMGDRASQFGQIEVLLNALSSEMSDLPDQRKEQAEAILQKIRGSLSTLMPNIEGEVPNALSLEAQTNLAKSETEYRELAELAHQEAHEKAIWMSRFPDENPNPVARVSMDGTILYCNRASAQPSGWAFKVGEQLVDPFLSLVEEAHTQGKQMERDIQIGETFYAITLMPFPSDQYVNLYGLDVSERKHTEEALVASERKYRELIQYAPTGIYEIDFRTGKFTSVNESMAELTGYSREELLQMRGSDLLDEAGQVRLQERIRQWLAGEKPDENVEYRVKAKDGHTIYAILNATFTKDEQGRPLGATVIGYDITEQKRLEEARYESETGERARANELEALMDTAPAVIWISRDPECREMIGNRYSYDFLKIHLGENVSKTAPEEDLVVQQYHMEVNGHPVPAAELPMQIAAATGKPANDYAFDLIHADGRSFNMFGNVNPLLDQEGRPYGAIGVFVDLTNLRHLEAEQMMAKAEIEVQRRLMDQREQERLAIARDLHDGPIQTLSSTIFNLQMIKDLFPDQALHVELNQVGMDIKNSIHEIREVLNDLRPPALMHFGFCRMIQIYTEDLRERYPDIEINLDVMDDNRILSDQATLALYRIYQAGINNIVRHSEATKAWVTYKIEQDSFSLGLRDNGKGFDLTEDFTSLTRNGHFGLVGMKERAEAVGGVFSVSSEPGGGTTIVVKGPLLGKNLK